MASGDENDLLQIPATLSEGVAPSASKVDAAPEEAAQLGSGLPSSELRRRAETNEHGRAEKFKDHFEGIAIAALYGIAMVFTVLGLIWFWHLIVPVDWRWLAADDVSRLQNFVTGGIIATIAGGHIKKRLG